MQLRAERIPLLHADRAKRRVDVLLDGASAGFAVIFVFSVFWVFSDFAAFPAIPVFGTVPAFIVRVAFVSFGVLASAATFDAFARFSAVFASGVVAGFVPFDLVYAVVARVVAIAVDCLGCSTLGVADFTGFTLTGWVVGFEADATFRGLVLLVSTAFTGFTGFTGFVAFAAAGSVAMRFARAGDVAAVAFVA